MQKREKYPLSLYNTLGRDKTVFTPIHEDYVGMYVCGPTVYSDPHLGHARGAVTFDLLFRYLRALGYRVRYVRNITDVGHLEDEVADAGEDKIAKRARLEKVEPMEIVQTYTISYRQAVEALNTLPPSIEPTATGHMIEQIDIIKRIIESGLAYEENGSVYFDVKAYADKYPYGELSGKVLDDLISGTRNIEGGDEKKNHFDFALWKKAKPEHLMSWDSPWSRGFPGWHVECTAMSSKYLGIPFDIHGGGMDLKFPHHECEIAQSVGAFSEKPVNTWVHNNMLTINGSKMSKSAGNFITLEEFFSGNHKLLNQAYSPMTIRFFILQAHYRSAIDFSNEALAAAEKGYKRLMNSLETCKGLADGTGSANGEEDKMLNSQIDELYLNMSDDLNTAKVLAVMFDLGNIINSLKNGQMSLSSFSPDSIKRLKEEFSLFINDILGLKEEEGGQDDRMDKVMDVLISLRKDARANKDFATSDKIRDELAAAGVQLKDEKDGTTTYSLS